MRVVAHVGKGVQYGVSEKEKRREDERLNAVYIDQFTPTLPIATRKSMAIIIDIRPIPAASRFSSFVFLVLYMMNRRVSEKVRKIIPRIKNIISFMRTSIL